MELESYLASLSEGELDSTGTLQLDFTKLAEKISQTGGVNASYPLLMTVMAAVAGQASSIEMSLKETVLQAKFLPSTEPVSLRSCIEALNQVVMASLGSPYKSWSLTIPGKHTISGSGRKLTTAACHRAAGSEIQFQAYLAARSVTARFARIPRMDILAKLRHHLQLCNIPVRVNGHLLNRSDCRAFLPLSGRNNIWQHVSWEPTADSDYFPMLEHPLEQGSRIFQHSSSKFFLPDSDLEAARATLYELGPDEAWLREVAQPDCWRWIEGPIRHRNAFNDPGTLWTSNGILTPYASRLNSASNFVTSSLLASGADSPCARLRQWSGKIKRGHPADTRADAARFFYVRLGVLLNPLYQAESPRDYVTIVARSDVRLDLLNLRPVQDDRCLNDLRSGERQANALQSILAVADTYLR